MKIDLNELCRGWYIFSSEFDDILEKLEIKPLREHLEELVNNDWECINENREHIQNILNGVEDLEVSDLHWDVALCRKETDETIEEVRFESLSEVKRKKGIWARKQGIEPHKTWYEIEAEEKKLEGLPF